MNECKIALITGITGQDGSYLAELLLEKKYIVWGIIRRASDINTHRIDHLYTNSDLILRYGDMTDSSNLLHIINEIKNKYPHIQRFEVYNLAAMSHVKVSFEMPEYTTNVGGLGVLRLLEAIRNSGLISKCRFYQASTSELYGKVQEVPQTETTPFYPRSPYGVAKLYGYWIVKNYRESYNMFASNGILFNHESLADFMPLIFKQNSIVDIKPISEIVKHHTRLNESSVDERLEKYQEVVLNQDLYVWDNNDWTKVTFASGYKHNVLRNNKNPKFVISNNAAYFATENHVIILENGDEEEIRNISIGDKLKLINFDNIHLLGGSSSLFEAMSNSITLDEGEFLGLMVGKGSIKINKRIYFTNKNRDVINYVKKLWENIGIYNNKKTSFIVTSTKENLYQICLIGFNEFFNKYKIYNEDKTKRVPYQILNISKEIQVKFLEGYSKAYGRAEIKSNSATLAQGLIFLINKTTKQEFGINVELLGAEKDGRKKIYYSITSLSRAYKSNLSKAEVKKIIEFNDFDGWFYDLETESGTFSAGLGVGILHNSPRRGPTFVTRKITRGLNMILTGERDKLILGNLDAKRDWGHAIDFIKGMWMILQADKPDDYVLSSNESHSVREFVEKAFAIKGFCIKWKGKGVNEIGYDEKTGREVVVVNERYFRPTEVEELLGDSTKARTELKWNPIYSFDELVEEMVNYDCK